MVLRTGRCAPIAVSAEITPARAPAVLHARSPESATNVNAREHVVFHLRIPSRSTMVTSANRSEGQPPMPSNLHSRHDRPRPRILGDTTELGGLDREISVEGLQRARSGVSRIRRRGRGAQRRPDPDRAVGGSGDHRTARVDHRRPRQAADHHGSFGRWRVHPDPARPRLRRRRRGDQLGADRGRQGHPAVPGQGHVPGPQEPRQPAQGGRVHVRAVAVRVHQRIRGGRGAAGCTTATTSPPPVTSSGGARSPTSIPARTTPTSTTRIPTAPRSCSSPAAKTT